MSQSVKKSIIAIIIFIVLVALLGVFLVKGLEVGPIKLLSISSLGEMNTEISKEKATFSQKQTSFKTAKSESDSKKAEFTTQKNKYEAISDETVKVIKDATTEDNYNIEYMWIKLGNYAKSNNLSLVVIEPGGTREEEKNETEGTETTQTGSTSSGTKISTTTGMETDEESIGDRASARLEQQTSEATEELKENVDKVVGDTAESVSKVVEGAIDPSSKRTMKIEVTGSYIDISDFIFEVENDTTLKFKLDNISITNVSGTTIKTTFDVKNTYINK